MTDFFWHPFVAGEVGGAVSVVISFPFDTVKTRLQMQAERSSVNTFRAISHIVRNEGVVSIFKGVAYPFMAFGVLFSIAFGANANAQRLCLDRRNSRLKQKGSLQLTESSQLPFTDMFCCGALAGFCSSIPRTAVERVKCWSQVHKTGSIASTRAVFSRYGFRKGLMCGFGSTVCREVPQFASYYPIYEMSCRLIAPGITSKSEMNSVQIWLSGAIAGMGSWTLTYPIDVVKTRIQSSAPNRYRGFAHCARCLLHEFEGSIRPFFNGFAPTMYRAAVLHSSMFLCYERVLHFLRRQPTFDIVSQVPNGENDTMLAYT